MVCLVRHWLGQRDAPRQLYRWLLSRYYDANSLVVITCRYHRLLRRHNADIITYRQRRYARRYIIDDTLIPLSSRHHTASTPRQRHAEWSMLNATTATATLRDAYVTQYRRQFYR